MNFNELLQTIGHWISMGITGLLTGLVALMFIAYVIGVLIVLFVIGVVVVRCFVDSIKAAGEPIAMVEFEDGLPTPQSLAAEIIRLRETNRDALYGFDGVWSESSKLRSIAFLQLELRHFANRTNVPTDVMQSVLASPDGAANAAQALRARWAEVTQVAT